MPVDFAADVTASTASADNNPIVSFTKSKPESATARTSASDCVAFVIR